jgi:hypothetical protein
VNSDCGSVLVSASERGTVLDSASECGMDTIGSIINYNFSDVTMTNYGKFPEFADASRRFGSLMLTGALGGLRKRLVVTPSRQL